MKKEISYEEAYKELTQIVSDMEQEEIAVDVLADKIRRATELIRVCREKLLISEGEVDQALKDFKP
jgi:exodeoxyribonuclease VII small subunit